MKFKKLTPAQKKRWKQVLLVLALLVGGYLLYRRRKNSTTPSLPGQPGGNATVPTPGQNLQLGGINGTGYYSNTAKLRAIEYAYTPVSRPGVMEWSKFRPFRLRDDEVFIWDAKIDSPAQVDEILARGVTHINQNRLRDIGRKDVPASRRYILAQRNNFGTQIDTPNPDLSQIPDSEFESKFRGFLGGQKDFSDGQAGRFIATNFEVGNDASGPYVQRWGNILHKLMNIARNEYGATQAMSFDLHPSPTGADSGHPSTQWQAFRNAGMNATLANAIPYIRLDMYYDYATGAEHAVNDPSKANFLQERKNTEYKWFAKFLHSIEVNKQVSEVPLVGFLTPGWAQSGFPQKQAWATRPDMWEAAVIFGLMMGLKGILPWTEMTHYTIVNDYWDAMIAAYLRMSAVNEFRGQGTSLATAQVSVDGGANWYTDTARAAETGNRPTVRAREANGRLLIAAYDPKLFDGTRTIRVRSGLFQEEITLKPYRVFLGVNDL